MTEPPTTEMSQPDRPTGPGPLPRPVPPPHHAGWAVTALLFFWPLAFSAFSHAFNVYPLWAAGDFAGAQYASDRVRRLGQLSLWIFGGFLVVFGILYAISLIVFFAQGDMDWGRHGMDYAAGLRLATTT